MGKGFGKHKLCHTRLGAVSKKSIIATLTSREFKQHIHETLLGMPPQVYESLLKKLIKRVRQGYPERWLGFPTPGGECRVGYEPGNCYTMLIKNGVGYCYNFNNQSCSIVNPTLPDEIWQLQL